ncbi:MAG TPA: hypothetical protein VE733_11965 [Streptosporangiaceae bacterium]|nr:hypothetical protein [Streptosporangiaceae bacterium]
MSQLRRVTEKFEGMMGLSGSLPLQPTVPTLPGLPLPGALTAAQLESIASGVTAQRRSIQALQAQLTAFDEQLAVLEGILGPLAQWSRTWAKFEGLLTNVHRKPEAES